MVLVLLLVTFIKLEGEMSSVQIKPLATIIMPYPVCTDQICGDAVFCDASGLLTRNTMVTNQSLAPRWI